MPTQDLQQPFWLGADVAKESFDVCAAPVGAPVSDWARLPVAHFSMSAQGLAAFEAWLKPLLAQGGCAGFCIESTGVYSHRFVRFVAPLGLPPIAMLNPALPVAFRKSLGLRDKCDRVDAAVIALYGTVHRPAPNTQKPPEYERLRALWRMHEVYASEVREWKNRLEQLMDPAMESMLNDTIACIEEQRRALWKQLLEWVAQTPALHHDMALLCSIPGVGKKTALMALAELGDLRAWKRPQLASYAGLYPRLFQSGTSVNRKPALAKGGGARIRSALFLPACTATKYNPHLSQWRKQLLERGKAKKSTIAAVMRKMLLLMRAVLISNNPYDKEFKAANSA
jgi:transposase